MHLLPGQGNVSPGSCSAQQLSMNTLMDPETVTNISKLAVDMDNDQFLRGAANMSQSVSFVIRASGFLSTSDMSAAIINRA